MKSFETVRKNFSTGLLLGRSPGVRIHWFTWLLPSISSIASECPLATMTQFRRPNAQRRTLSEAHIKVLKYWWSTSAVCASREHTRGRVAKVASVHTTKNFPLTLQPTIVDTNASSFPQQHVIDNSCRGRWKPFTASLNQLSQRIVS